MAFSFVIIAWVLNKAESFSAITFMLYSAIYLLFCMILYTRIKEDENIKNYLKVSVYLNHAYTEVVPLHPKLLAIKYNFNRKETIKAYARVPMGNMVCIKLVTKSQTLHISTSDWTWFVCNFAEKEPK